MGKTAAMIFAAGKGTRLGELGQQKAKCLLEAGGKTMLEHILHRLRGVGIERVVLNLHHRADDIRRYLQENENFGFDVCLSFEDELLDTGGGLKRAQQYFDRYEEIVVHNGDMYWEGNLLDVLKRHRETNALATLVTVDPGDPRVLLFEPSSGLRGWENQDSGARKTVGEIDFASLQRRGFLGVQVVSSRLFAILQELPEKCSIIEAYLLASSLGKLVGEYPLGGSTWFDIGTPERLSAWQNYLGG